MGYYDDWFLLSASKRTRSEKFWDAVMPWVVGIILPSILGLAGYGLYKLIT